VHLVTRSFTYTLASPCHSGGARRISSALSTQVTRARAAQAARRPAKVAQPLPGRHPPQPRLHLALRHRRHSCHVELGGRRARERRVSASRTSSSLAAGILSHARAYSHERTSHIHLHTFSQAVATAVRHVIAATSDRVGWAAAGRESAASASRTSSSLAASMLDRVRDPGVHCGYGSTSCSTKGKYKSFVKAVRIL
jgi:hypothetical protein